MTVSRSGDNFLMRGPRPSSTISTGFELAKISRQPPLKAIAIVDNFKTIISLEQGWFEWFHNQLGSERKWARNLRYNLVQMPLSSVFAPTMQEVDMFINQVKFSMQLGSVFVHCKKGKDRTGFMIACYRILVQGWTKKAAVDEMVRLGFNTTLYWFWIKHVGAGR